MSLEVVTDVLAGFLIGCVALLDSLPDYIRALLCAGMLVAFLRYFESRIPADDIQYSEAFCKTSLLALLIVPLLVGLLPSMRMVVFVDELTPAVVASNSGWLLVPGVWLAGLGLSFGMLVLGCLRRRRHLDGLLRPLDDERLCGRLRHWQTRLGMRRRMSLVVIGGAEPGINPGRHRIGLPSAALHWPPGAQDVLLIHQLCHVKLRHRGWHLLSQVVICVYWPVTWLAVLRRRLLAGFQLATDGLAETCFSDSMGYSNGLRQVEQRLLNPPPVKEKPRVPSESGSWPHRMIEACRGYAARLSELLKPECELPCHVRSWKETRRALRWVEPYDKVFLFVGQSVLIAFLLTGVTLRETPPVVEADYRFLFEVNWMDEYFRPSERLDDAPPRDPRQ